MRADRTLISLVSSIGRLLRLEADRRARSGGMTRARWAVLAHVHRQPGIMQRELAEIAEVEPMTVARLVDRLERGGFIERRPDPADRRCWHLYLTECAAPLLDNIEDQMNDVAALMAEGLSEAEMLELADMLLRLRDRLHAATRRSLARGEAMTVPA